MQHPAFVNRREFLRLASVSAAALATSAVLPASALASSKEVVLPPLPFAENALDPVISARTLSYHYGKHHAGYVKKTNAAIAGTEFAAMDLEKIIAEAAHRNETGLFNNAAQVWNHTFYWHSVTPGSAAPSGELKAMIERDFGSLEHCKEELIGAAGGQFGSGWGWLVHAGDKLAAIRTPNAMTPLVMDGLKPLLTVDVWEHAYYLDYQNARGDYLKAVADKLLNWDFAAKNLMA